MIIKVISAGVGYLMFVALARALSDTEFGKFAFAFSLATSLSWAAGVGQATGILRFWPQYNSIGRPDLAKGVLLFGYGATLAGGVITTACAVGTIAVVWLIGRLPEPNYLYASAGLAFMLALAEYQANAMRAAGLIVKAFLPRDIVWRIALPAFVLAFVLAGIAPTASMALWAGAVGLGLLLLIQAVLFLQTLRPWRSELAHYDFATWRKVGVGLWALGILAMFQQSADVIMLGLFFSPEATGGYFVALKTASLLSLPLMAANLIAAPLIARLYHAGETNDVQTLCRTICLAITGPSLAGFLFFVTFGDWLLGFFGDSYRHGHDLLIILSCGFLVNALSGASGFLLTMTGHERKLFQIQLTTYVGMLAVMFVAIPVFGTLGAAVANMSAQIVWNLWARGYAVRVLRIDPSLLSVLQIHRRKS